MTLIEWFVNGETGNSSQTLALWLSECKRANRVSFPYDPSDFRRCLLLLDSVPELRKNLATLPALSPEWAAIYQNWEALETTLREELAAGNRAPRTYRLLKQVLEQVGAWL